MSKINFVNKRTANNPAVPQAPLETLSAADINEIKVSVNSIYDTLENPLLQTFNSEKVEIQSNKGTTKASVKTEGINSNGDFANVELSVKASDNTVRKVTFGTRQIDKIVVTDEITGVGLTYATDYSSTFIDRSLVDKGYVDKQFGKYSDIITVDSVSVQYTFSKTLFSGNIDFNSVIFSASTFINTYYDITPDDVIIFFETAPQTNIPITILGF